MMIISERGTYVHVRYMEVYWARILESSAILAPAPGWWAPAAAANAVGIFRPVIGLNDGNSSTADVSSERDRELTFAICYRPSVCRLSVLRRSSHKNPFVGGGLNAKKVAKYSDF